MLSEFRFSHYISYAIALSFLSSFLGLDKGFANEINKDLVLASSPRLVTQIPQPDRVPVPDAVRPFPPQPDLRPPSQIPIPEPTPLPVPSQLEDLLESPQDLTVPEPSPPNIPDTIRVQRFDVIGSTVFDREIFEAITASYTDRPITFNELLQVRSAITQLYVDQGYITSGAILPPQRVRDGVVIIQVVEGRLEDINVVGAQRLNSNYVRDRLAIAGSSPVNFQRLLEGLQLLQLDPLIETISADLQAGTSPDRSVLEVQVVEANTLSAALTTDNQRSPSVGSVRRQIQLNQANLLGFGDGLSVGYINTDGSDSLEIIYSIPLNPKNGTVSVAYGAATSEVIEPPFDRLDIESESDYFEASFRQPLVLKPNEEFALGFTVSHQSSQAFLPIPEGGIIPLSPGADEEGQTRISALRFYQEWTQRSSQHVFAARSQVSVGVDLLDATINDDAPDSRFVAWRGQAQWVRLLAPDMLALLRVDIQLADDSLLSLEQVGLGGQLTVRGYRQDVLLTDNGALASAEIRLPILRIPEVQGLLQIAPFVDVGTGWNNSENEPDPNTLLGIGAGLLWRMGDRFSARLDWGIPLVSIDSSSDTLQEDGIYFSVVFTPF